MSIPQGDWLVVTRKVRDTSSRGDIQRSGLTEEQARERVRAWREHPSSRGVVDTWAIHKSEY